MASYKELKREAFEANLELPKRGLVLYTFGNASAADRKSGMIAIKPSGVEYDDLTADMMVVVDMNGVVVDGKHRPSSDTKTHCVLYRAFGNIRGVVHTHSTYATAWAQAMRAIPCFGTTHADHLPGNVPCTEMISDVQIKKDYEEETGNQIVSAFRKLNPDETPMVLVAGHGPFTWGASAAKAAYNSVILEELAKMASITCSVTPHVKAVKRSLIEKHFYRKHGADAYYGQKNRGDA
ncbi:MAG: L-ribulose-5-phosphate 4-epimerase AraD [Spirochaetes bacterium]|nr:L-ribulose-5-phosphate 4-epimerase AraD [Spirochaetota bacterium]